MAPWLTQPPPTRLGATSRSWSSAVESFGGRLRDELLAVEAFNTLLEARVLVQDWRIEYNTVRPHSAWAT
jgi:transposase InsO family protein